MLKQEKQEKIALYDSLLEGSEFAILAEYAKIRVTAVERMRHELDELGCSCVVMKNTLANIVFERRGSQEICSFLTGPTFAFIGHQDIATVAKKIQRYMREFPYLKVKAVFYDGKAYDQADFKSFLTLPTKQETRASLASVLLAPITKLVRVLNTPQRIAGVLGAYANKRGQAEA
jgi:large subunit ribosomal protein L10